MTEVKETKFDYEDKNNLFYQNLFCSKDVEITTGEFIHVVKSSNIPFLGFHLESIAKKTNLSNYYTWKLINANNSSFSVITFDIKNFMYRNETKFMPAALLCIDDFLRRWASCIIANQDNFFNCSVVKRCSFSESCLYGKCMVDYLLIDFIKQCDSLLSVCFDMNKTSKGYSDFFNFVDHLPENRKPNVALARAFVDFIDVFLELYINGDSNQKNSAGVELFTFFILFCCYQMGVFADSFEKKRKLVIQFDHFDVTNEYLLWKQVLNVIVTSIDRVNCFLKKRNVEVMKILRIVLVVSDSCKEALFDSQSNINNDLFSVLENI